MSLDENSGYMPYPLSDFHSPARLSVKHVRCHEQPANSVRQALRQLDRGERRGPIHDLNSIRAAVGTVRGAAVGTVRGAAVGTVRGDCAKGVGMQKFY